MGEFSSILLKVLWGNRMRIRSMCSPVDFFWFASFPPVKYIPLEPTVDLVASPFYLRRYHVSSYLNTTLHGGFPSFFSAKTIYQERTPSIVVCHSRKTCKKQTPTEPFGNCLQKRSSGSNSDRWSSLCQPMGPWLPTGLSISSCVTSPVSFRANFGLNRYRIGWSDCRHPIDAWFETRSMFGHSFRL